MTKLLTQESNLCFPHPIRKVEFKQQWCGLVYCQHFKSALLLT